MGVFVVFVVVVALVIIVFPYGAIPDDGLNTRMLSGNRALEDGFYPCPIRGPPYREPYGTENPLPTRNPNRIEFHVAKIKGIMCWNNGVSPFQIRRLEGDREAVFSVHPCEGVIPPEDEVVVTATYSPVSTGTFSRDHYEVVTVGGNKV